MEFNYFSRKSTSPAWAMALLLCVLFLAPNGMEATQSSQESNNENHAEKRGSIELPPFSLRNIASSANMGSEKDSCGLACWLANLTINIPAQSTVELGFNLTISDMICKGIQIGGINSSYVPPTTLILNPYNVQIECTANWSFYEMDFLHLSGSGGVLVSVDNTKLLFGMKLNKSPNGLAESATTTECSTSITIANIEFTGSVLSDILDVFKSFIESTVQTELDSVVCTELTQLVNTNLTLAIQEVDQLIFEYLVVGPPSPAPPVPSYVIINLEEDPIIKAAGYIIHSLFTSTGQLSFNMLVDRFTNGTGTYNLTAEQLSAAVFTVPVVMNNASFANVTIGITGVNLTNLATWGDVELSPESKYSMNFQTSMSSLNFNVSFFVNVSLVGDDYILYEEAILIVKMVDNHFNSSFQLAINEPFFDTLQAIQFMDVGCLLAMLYNVNITQLFFSMNATDVDIFAEGGSIEQDLDQVIDNTLALFTHSFELGIPAFFNGIVAVLAQQEGNKYLGELLYNDTTPCEPAPPPPSTIDMAGTGGSFGGAGALIAAIGLILIAKNKRKHQHTLESDEETSPIIKAREEPPLVFHPKLSFFTRFIIPFLLLVNVAMFISSNTSVGASVFVILQAGSRSFTTPALFNFSLGNSVRDMWNAGVYPLSILIAVFSGSWPYLKLLIMLICWFLPTRVLAVKRREYLLMALDMLGKWSLIDAFVMTLMMVAFQFHISSPPIPDTNPPEYATADVYVEPHWGFYLFLVATMSSLIMTHIILGLHKYTTEKATTEQYEEKKALWVQAYESDESSPHWIRFKQSAVVILLLICLVLIVVGSYLYSFAFNFRGAAGLLLILLGEPDTTSYSILSLGYSLPGAAPPGGLNAAGTMSIAVTYFTFTFVVPLAHLVTLLILWVTPLTHTAQKRLFVVSEVLNAWSALEVFVISIIAAVLEIRQFAAFIVGDKCNFINPIFKEYFDKELNGDATCFDVIATLDSGCWVLFIACIIYIAVATVVMRLCHRILDEYESAKDRIN